MVPHEMEMTHSINPFASYTVWHVIVLSYLKVGT